MFNERDSSIISDIPLNQDIFDSWYCFFDRLGVYSIKSAYIYSHNLSHEEDSEDCLAVWKTIWSLKVPPKVQIFLWQATSGCLPTYLQLQTRHVPIENRCPLCNLAPESIRHVLCSCSFARECWIASHLVVDLGENSPFFDWLQGVFVEHKGDTRNAMVMLCWSIWHCRNNLVWNQKGTDILDVISVSRLVYAQWKASQDRNFDLSLGLINIHDGADRWICPATDTIKFNIDAALFAHSGCFSISWVAKNDWGNLLEARARCMEGHPAPEVAEIMGIKEALSWIKHKGLKGVVLETDCLEANQAIRCATDFSSYFGCLAKECRVLLSDLKHCNVSIQFIKQYANFVAHFLAKATSFIVDRVWSGTDIPYELAFVIGKDLD